MDYTKGSGFAFFPDKRGKIFSCDVHRNAPQSSVSGILQSTNPSFACSRYTKQVFAIGLPSDGEEFASVAGNGALRFANSLKHLQAIAREFCVLLSYVKPTLIG